MGTFGNRQTLHEHEEEIKRLSESGHEGRRQPPQPPILPYEECWAKHEPAFEHMDIMELAMLISASSKSKDPSDITFNRAIHWEIKLRSQKRGKYAEEKQ
jgi:hypothetical protein